MPCKQLFSMLFLFFSLVVADWVNPPSDAYGITGDYSQNNVYSIGSTILLEWETSYKLATIRINQDVARGNTYWDFAQSITNTGSLNWTVQVPSNMNLTELPVFWFVCLNAEDTQTLVKSHYFNITSRPIPATTSSASPIASTSSTILGSSSTTAGSTGSPNSSPSTSAMSGNGLSRGAKIGIGVGASFGALCFVAAVTYGYLFHKQRRNGLAPRGEVSTVAEVPRSSSQVTKQYQGVSYHQTAQTPELAGNENNSRYYEMDGRREKTG